MIKIALSYIYILPLAIVLCTVPTMSSAERIEKTCERINFAGEVSATNGYRLRFCSSKSAYRRYFVYDDRTGCSFIIGSHFDPNSDRIWLFSMDELAVESQFVRSAPIRISRFLQDRSLELKIVSNEFAECRKTKSRRECRELIGEKTRSNSAILSISRPEGKSVINFYMSEAYLSGETHD